MDHHSSEARSPGQTNCPTYFFIGEFNFKYSALEMDGFIFLIFTNSMPFYFLYGLQAAHNDYTFENTMVWNPTYEARSLSHMIWFIKFIDLKFFFLLVTRDG